MQPNNPRVDQERWEPQKQDVGIAEVHIRGKIVRITISMIQWPLSRATKGVKDRIEGMANKTEGRVVVHLEGIEISRAMRSKARRGVSMRRGRGMRDMLGDQTETRERGIGSDIGVGVRVARGTELATVAGTTASAIGIVIKTVIGETEGIRLVIRTVIGETQGIRLVILYIRNQFSEHVPRDIISFRHLYSSCCFHPHYPKMTAPQDRHAEPFSACASL